MKVRTHYKLAQIAVKRLDNSMPDALYYGMRAKLFCIGTILPDFSINQFIHRHFYPLSGQYIAKKIKRLAQNGRSGWLQALRAGAIAHFLSDFCCTVHSSGGVGNIREHILYERKIHRYVFAKSGRFSEGHAQLRYYGDLDKELMGIVDEWHRMSDHSCEQDVRSCVEICEQLYGRLFKRSRQPLIIVSVKSADLAYLTETELAV